MASIMPSTTTGCRQNEDFLIYCSWCSILMVTLEQNFGLDGMDCSPQGQL